MPIERVGDLHPILGGAVQDVELGDEERLLARRAEPLPRLTPVVLDDLRQQIAVRHAQPPVRADNTLVHLVIGALVAQDVHRSLIGWHDQT